MCAASSIRAMPEKEKPPAMRVDNYYIFRVYRVSLDMIKLWYGIYCNGILKEGRYEKEKITDI